MNGICSDDKPFYSYGFPYDKNKIAKLSIEEKLEWYSHQIQVAAQFGSIAVALTSTEFMRFWKWRVLIPLKLKRFYYRVKNLEVFKKYPHISQMRPKVKQHSI